MVFSAVDSIEFVAFLLLTVNHRFRKEGAVEKSALSVQLVYAPVTSTATGPLGLLPAPLSAALAVPLRAALQKSSTCRA